MSQSIDSILVPTDGSEGALAGARRGINFAESVGADLYTLSVVETRETEEPLETLDSDERTKQSELWEESATGAVEAVSQLATAHLTGSVTKHVEQGIPHRVISEYVARHDIDSIVMGTHGRTGLQRFLLGSVAEKVLRTSQVPVCVIPPETDETDIENIRYEDVLLPTDGSKGAERAVEWGVGLAEAFDASLHTVYSVDTSRMPASEGSAYIHGALEETGQRALAYVRNEARDHGVSVSGNIGSGPPAKVVLAYAEEQAVDLIVMGTHGRTGVERYLIGSVTEEVVRNAAVPVWCVPMEANSAQD